jgi:hypothetical protein
VSQHSHRQMLQVTRRGVHSVLQSA